MTQKEHRCKLTNSAVQSSQGERKEQIHYIPKKAPRDFPANELRYSTSFGSCKRASVYIQVRGAFFIRNSVPVVEHRSSLDVWGKNITVYASLWDSREITVGSLHDLSFCAIALQTYRKIAGKTRTRLYFLKQQRSRQATCGKPSGVHISFFHST